MSRSEYYFNWQVGNRDASRGKLTNCCAMKSVQRTVIRGWIGGFELSRFAMMKLLKSFSNQPIFKFSNYCFSSPSHLQTTAVATAFPTTFVALRPMSSN